MLTSILATGLLFAQGAMDASAELKRLAERMKEAGSVRGKILQTVDNRDYRVHFQILAPGSFILISDEAELYKHGTDLYRYLPLAKLYSHTKLRPEDAQFPRGTFIGFDSLLCGHKFPYEAIGEMSMTQFQNRDCLAMALKGVDEAGRQTVTLYLDAKDRLPAGYTILDGDRLTTGVYFDVAVKAGLRGKDFQWKPPRGAKEF